MTSHICWLGLKYVTSQRTFCGLCVGLYVGILKSSLKQVYEFLILSKVILFLMTIFYQMERFEYTIVHNAAFYSGFNLFAMLAMQWQCC